MAKPTRKVIAELTLLLALASATIALLFVLYGPDEGFSTLSTVLFVLPLVIFCVYLGELSQRKNRKK
jgi:VIT1/CCC1 family predicted Fe2+/Mn2+ transporter